MSGRGAERVLLLIEWIATREKPFTFTEVVKGMGLPKSSTLATLRLLSEMGYIEMGADKRYYLVRLPGQLSTEYKAWGTLKSAAENILREVVNEVHESGFVAVMEEDFSVRYLLKLLPVREIRYERDVSIPRRAHQVSAGIVLLSSLKTEELHAYAKEEHAFGRLKGTAEELVERVDRARKAGVYVNPTGVFEGAAGISSPILDQEGRVVAALNVAGPAERMTPQLNRIQEAVIKASVAISSAISMGLPNKDSLHLQSISGEMCE